jgi:AbrB family looped-hinge helix DNA binding protein
MPIGTITSKGQTTVPKEIRDKLGLKPGDKIVWTVENGRVRLRAKNRSIKELAGFLRRPGQKPASLEEIDEAIAQAATESALGDDRPRYKRPA